MFLRGDKTWKEEENEKANLDTIFIELMQDCKYNPPGARLSAKVRTTLERLSPAERRELVIRTRDGCAPLFVAARRSNVEVVEYLVHVCGAPLEQRGIYEMPDERSAHLVTPLWCAAVSGRLPVLRALADAGADINAASDSGSTPVRSACFMTHIEVVKFLVERGADIHRPNHDGGTCLINSVQSTPLCAFLLSHGAEVNARDMQRKTALHYAIQEHRRGTVQLLLQHGASPLLASRAGDDALRTACLKGASLIVDSLLAADPPYYNLERAADAYELLGATEFDEFNDVAGALSSWRHATAIRHRGTEYLEKRPWVPEEAAEECRSAAENEALWAAAGSALCGTREWRTAAELDAAATDVDALRTQALLVAARTLGPAHKDCLFRLMYRGAAYADADRYRRCVDLWTWALHIRIFRDSLLSTDTCHTASALTRLFLDAADGRLERAGADFPPHSDVSKVFTLLAEELPGCRTALRARPVHKKQAETFDRALRCVTHLLHLLLATARDEEQRDAVEAAARRLVSADLRSAHTGDSVLHLCASRLNVVRSTYFADELATPPVFPSVEVVKLLLRAGADARLRNEARSTPLHVAAIPYNFSTELVEALLAGGAHLDQPNRFGDSAAELLTLSGDSRVRPLLYTSLRCLAARALLAAGPSRAPSRTDLPLTLLDFLDLHRS
ncbi:unnamed protein product [Leptosia nina]|uniref:Uncharacterized protein n=1 Tax=Leptosia nina TaxID=320188 RepID=A0AAV1IYQ0_9NEOP